MDWRFLVMLGLAGCTVSQPGGDTGFPVAMMSTGQSSDDNADGETSPKTTGISADSGNEGSGDEAGSSSGGEDDGSTTSGDSSSSGGDPNACDPLIPGEWNDCTEDDGTVDNTLCNWVPNTEANGWISCLNSSSSSGSSVCMISDCVDACDCFAPPSTGTAVVACDAILEGGGTACHLDCSVGTCPDGMECQSNICFWPAPP